MYDSAAEQSLRSCGEWRTRPGDIHSSHPERRALRLECRHFLSLVGGEGDPLSPARDGVRVVRVLEQLQTALERQPA